jgi:hypothetical protein
MTAVVLALLLALSACSGGGDDEDERDETSSTSFEQPSVALEVRSADLVSSHAARAPLAGDVTAAITDVVEELLLVTSATPLALGDADDGVGELFTLDAGAEAVGADRPAIFDDGLPSFGELSVDDASIGITALNGPFDSTPVFAVVDLQWDVSGSRNPTDRVVRTGELSLVLDAGGAWKIAAYDLHVERTIDDETTTTTAEAG